MEIPGSFTMTLDENKVQTNVNNFWKAQLEIWEKQGSLSSHLI